MSNVSKSILIAAVVALFSLFTIFQSSAFAKDEPNAPPKAKMGKNGKGEHKMAGNRMHQRMNELSEKLNLTEEQKKTIRPIIESEVDKIQAVNNDSALTPEQKQLKIASIRQSSRDEINKVLTPEQQAKWMEMKQEARQQAGENTKERTQKRIQNMSEKLNLTEDQKKKIEPILEKEANDLSAVRTDTSLTKEQRIEKIKQINAASSEEIKKVLTPEQQAKMEELKKRRARRHVTDENQQQKQESQQQEK